MLELLRTHRENSDRFRSDPRLGQLSPELRRLAVDYVSAPEPHGPPDVFVREAFPTIRYLERLFRTGALSATANRPGCATPISSAGAIAAVRARLHKGVIFGRRSGVKVRRLLTAPPLLPERSQTRSSLIRLRWRAPQMGRHRLD